MGNILSSLKDKMNKFYQRNVVYKVPCLDGIGVYIGETGRSFNTRPKEHQRDIKPYIIAQQTNEDLKKNHALVKHVWLNRHRIDWKSYAISAIESDYKKRRFLDSFYIHKTDFAFKDKINSFHSELYKLIHFQRPVVAAALVYCHSILFLLFILLIMQPLSVFEL